MKRQLKQLLTPLPVLTFFVVALTLIEWAATDAILRYVASFSLVALAAIFVSIGVHEGGHAVGGLLVNFDFHLLAVGPFYVVKQEQGLRVTLLNRWSRFLGFTLFVPSDTVNLRRRLIGYISAGPLASLTLSCITLILLLYQSPSYDFDVYVRNMPLWTVSKLIEYVFYASCVVFLMAILPITTGNIATDGGHIVRLTAKGPISDRWMAIMAVSFASIKGDRPRDWNIEWISHLTALSDVSPDAVMANYLAYRWAIDTKDYAKAQRSINQMLKSRFKVEALLRATLLTEATFFEFFYQKDFAKAQNLLAQLGQLIKFARPLPRFRLLCAQYVFASQPDKVQKTGQNLAKKMISTLLRSDNGIMCGEAEMFKDILERSLQENSPSTDAAPV